MFFDPKKLLLIAGPCAMENEDMVLEVAEFLVALQREFPALQIVFKSSFDKANRTSFDSKRGVGLKEGLRIFKTIKSHVPSSNTK